MNQPTPKDETLRTLIAATLGQADLTDAEIDRELENAGAGALTDAQVHRILLPVHAAIQAAGEAAAPRHSAAPERHSAPPRGTRETLMDRFSPRVSTMAGSSRHPPGAQPWNRGDATTFNNPRGATTALVVSAVCLAVALLATGRPQRAPRNRVRDTVVSAAIAAGRLQQLADSPQVARTLSELRDIARLAVGDVVRTHEHERRRMTLPDGSTLYINENTTARVEAARQLTVSSGEVFVDVVPAVNARRQRISFVVHTPDQTVTAVGTQFAVTAAANATDVLVTQGSVRLSGEDTPISAGKRIHCSAGQFRQTPAPRAAEALAWTRELMVAAPIVPASPHRGGSLISIDPDGQEMQLSLIRHHIDVHIEDGFARTTIDQTYFNQSWQQLEGTFRFPLPPDASLSRLAMYVGPRLMEGGMAERTHARNTFERIRHTKRDPALLEWVDGTTFRMRVFPLEARQEKRIILSYTQRLPVAYGRTRYRFPAGHSMDTVRDWSASIRVRNGSELSWNSPTHELTSQRDGGDLLLTTAPRHSRMQTDLVVELGGSAPSAGSAMFARAQLDESGYLMVRYQPPLPATGDKPTRHWVVLFECSADRDPVLARTQIEVVRTLLKNAEHQDTFSIVAANTRARVFRPEASPCTAANIAAAVEFLEQTHLVGALDLEAAFTTCSALPHDDRSEPHLVHVGSAQPVLGETGQQQLLRHLPKDVRYVGVGVGKRWSQPLMRAAAARSGGYFTNINPDENVAWRAFELLSALNAPRLLNVSVIDREEQLDFLTWADTIAHGDELCAIARLPLDHPLPDELLVSGILNGTAWTQTLPVRQVRENAGYLPRSWARLQIDRLMADNPARHHDDIVALSKSMYVMSPFTSLLVLENDQMYSQFGIDRGRQDHWAQYACPKTIAVVQHPDAPAEKRTVPDSLRNTVLRRRTTLTRGAEPIQVPDGGTLILGGIRIRPESSPTLNIYWSRPSGQRLGRWQQFDRGNAGLTGMGERPEGFDRLLRDFDPADALRQSMTTSGRVVILQEEPGANPANIGTGVRFYPFSETRADKQDAQQSATISALRNLQRGNSAPRGRTRISSPRPDGRTADTGQPDAGRFRYEVARPALPDPSIAVRASRSAGLVKANSDFGQPQAADQKAMLFRLTERSAIVYPGQSVPQPWWLQQVRPGHVVPMHPPASARDMIWLDTAGRRFDADALPTWSQAPPNLLFDLMAHAPGLNSWPADADALIEAESPPRRGRVDPAARQLIRKARRGVWQTITVTDSDRTTSAVQYNPRGQFVWHRTVSEGLAEHVVCDGHQMWHVYPELGLAARRPFSRFHRYLINSIAPWLVPDAAELAIGADVRALDEHTIAIVPWPGEDADPSETRATPRIRRDIVHLIFSPEGQLQERRLIDTSTKTVRLRTTFSRNGVVRTFDQNGTQISEVTRQIKNTPQGQLPDVGEQSELLRGIVVLPLPFRSADSVFARLGKAPAAYQGAAGDYSAWSANDALALMASDLCEAPRSAAGARRTLHILRQVFLDRGDRRAGLFVLAASFLDALRSEPELIDTETDPPLALVARFLSSSSLDQEFDTTALPPRSFLRNVTQARNVWNLWASGRSVRDRTPSQVAASLDAAIAVIEATRDPETAWALFWLVRSAPQLQTPQGYSKLADAIRRFERDPVLSRTAQDERIRLLLTAHRIDEALRLYAGWLRSAAKAGTTPPIDPERRQQFIRHRGQRDWTELCRQIGTSLLQQHGEEPALAFCGTLRAAGDADLSDDLFRQCLSQLEPTARPEAAILAIAHLTETGHPTKAEAIITQLLADERLSQSPQIWRLAASLADESGHTIAALKRLERAMRLEFDQRPDVVDLQVVRTGYRDLLSRYEKVIDASLTLEQSAPASLIRRVIRAADEWRSMEDDPSEACQLAARILRKLGQRELAWDYLTTPLAARPGPDAWRTLAADLASQNETQLADMAFRRAFAQLQTDPGILLEHAAMLHQQGQMAAARTLLERIVDGQWQPRFNSIVSQARDMLQ